MHDMQPIVTDNRRVCRYVSLSVSLSATRSHSVQPFETARAVCARSFGAAFAKSLWPLVHWQGLAGIGAKRSKKQVNVFVGSCKAACNMIDLSIYQRDNQMIWM